MGAYSSSSSEHSSISLLFPELFSSSPVLPVPLFLLMRTVFDLSSLVSRYTSPSVLYSYYTASRPSAVSPTVLLIAASISLSRSSLFSPSSSSDAGCSIFSLLSPDYPFVSCNFTHRIPQPFPHFLPPFPTHSSLLVNEPCILHL